MLHFSKREKKIFGLLLFTAALYIISQWIVRPLVHRAGLIKTGIALTETRLKKDRADLRLAEWEARQYRQTIHRYRQTSSDDETSAKLIKEIEDTAGEVKVSISDLKPRNSFMDGKIKNFPVSLTLEGGLDDIMHFLFILQNRSHALTVARFELSKSSPESSQLRCRLVLNRMFVVPAP